jgi:hypothetical protein
MILVQVKGAFVEVANAIANCMPDVLSPVGLLFE